VCQEVFAIQEDTVHLGSTGISQAGQADYKVLTQWRASLSQCRQVFTFIIGDPISASNQQRNGMRIHLKAKARATV